SRLWRGGRRGRGFSGTRAGAPLGGRVLEVRENACVVRRQLAVDALVVERFEQTLSRLAERRGFANQHGHRLGGAALAQQRGAERLITLASKAGVVQPQPRAIVGERLLDRLSFRRRPARPAGGRPPP